MACHWMCLLGVLPSGEVSFSSHSRGVDGEVGAAAARAPVVDDDGSASWKVSPLKVLSAHTRGRPLRGWLVSQSLQRVVSGILFIFRSRQGRASSW